MLFELLLASAMMVMTMIVSGVMMVMMMGRMTATRLLLTMKMRIRTRHQDGVVKAIIGW